MRFLAAGFSAPFRMTPCAIKVCPRRFVILSEAEHRSASEESRRELLALRVRRFFTLASPPFRMTVRVFKDWPRRFVILNEVKDLGAKDLGRWIFNKEQACITFTS